jgi:hypothetical protein
MVTEMVSQLDLATGLPSQSELIDWVGLFRGDPQRLIGSSSLLFAVLFETDVIAFQEEC